jgi:inner membrane protein
MLWGAFGGLLPDFDVFAMFFMDEVSALAFHRGIMHSILFAVLSAFGLGGLTERLYASGFYKRRGYKALVISFIVAIYALLGLGLHNILGATLERAGVVAGFVVTGLVILFLLWSRYFQKDLAEVNASRKEWSWLFFVSIVTHPILDSFTSFGTQLFEPFSNYRVAFNNIAVVDPLYSVPFALCLLIASFIRREKKARRIFNWLGIGISSAYMVFTLYHKQQFDHIFEQSLKEKGIVAQRFTSSPTILNNFLWQGMAEGDSAYYHGFYSFFDKEPRVAEFNVLPKNHHMIAQWQGEREIRILRWFSKDYYNVIVRKDGKLQYNDLRYGTREENFEKESSYIFRFILEEKDGQLEVRQTREDQRITGEAFRKFINRVFGKTN